jgi:hypothetical protein
MSASESACGCSDSRLEDAPNSISYTSSRISFILIRKSRRRSASWHSLNVCNNKSNWAVSNWKCRCLLGMVQDKYHGFSELKIRCLLYICLVYPVARRGSHYVRGKINRLRFHVNIHKSAMMFSIFAAHCHGCSYGNSIHITGFFLDAFAGALGFLCPPGLLAVCRCLTSHHPSGSH